MRQVLSFIVANIVVNTVANLALLTAPAVVWASEGHGGGSLQAISGASADSNLILMAMVGNIIVISIVLAEVIRSRTERSDVGRNG